VIGVAGCGELLSTSFTQGYKKVAKQSPRVPESRSPSHVCAPWCRTGLPGRLRARSDCSWPRRNAACCRNTRNPNVSWNMTVTLPQKPSGVLQN